MGMLFRHHKSRPAKAEPVKVEKPELKTTIPAEPPAKQEKKFKQK